MTDREKLIEMLEDAHREFYKKFDPNGDYFGTMADYLIASGVTFAKDTNVPSKWIPVTERLPASLDYYIVVVKFKYEHEKEYHYDTDVAAFTFDGGYIDDCWDTANDWNEGQQYLHVTHWMLLPEPPNED